MVKKSNKSPTRKPREPRTIKAFETLRNNDLWTPEDDILLIKNIQATKDFSILLKCVPFSKKFTLKELMDRWYAMLLDPVTIDLTNRRVLAYLDTVDENLSWSIKRLPSHKELYSISKIPSDALPNDSRFEVLHSDMETECFNYIYHVWSMLRWHNLLIDQTLDLLVEDYRIRNNDKVREIFGKNQPRQSIHQTNDIWHPFSTKRMIEKAKNKSKSKIVSDHLNANVLEQENIKYRDQLIKHDVLEIESYSSNVVGVLNGRFLSYEMDSPVLKVGFTDLEDFEIEENQVNLKLELHLPNMPEELFRIQYDAESGSVVLKNMTTTSQGDFGIFVTADDDVQCLLDGDVVELKDKCKIS